MKFLHNLNREGLVFKSVWGFFDTLIGCFVIYVSSSLINTLPIRITSEGIALDPFWKMQFPYIFFQVGILGVFEPNFKAIR